MGRALSPYPRSAWRVVIERLLAMVKALTQEGSGGGRVGRTAAHVTDGSRVVTVSPLRLAGGHRTLSFHGKGAYAGRKRRGSGGTDGSSRHRWVARCHRIPAPPGGW